MASFRRRIPRRSSFRRRRRVDMQTFRLCENSIDLVNGAFEATCDDPLVLMTKILAMNAGEAPTSRRSILFAGGHLRYRVNAAVIEHDDCPCSFPLHVVSAIVKLPLLEDTVTPAYVPNLTQSRTFDNVLARHNADNDEDILWWHDEQVDLMNVASSGGGAGCIAVPDCTGLADATQCLGRFSMLEAHASALYGRFTVDRRIAVKRRLREREALFLYTAVFGALGSQFADCPTWPIRINAYLRYAVR